MLRVFLVWLKVTAAHLQEIFENFGSVKNVELVVDNAVNVSKGYGYVEYENG